MPDHFEQVGRLLQVTFELLIRPGERHVGLL